MCERTDWLLLSELNVSSHIALLQLGRLCRRCDQFPGPVGAHRQTHTQSKMLYFIQPFDFATVLRCHVHYLLLIHIKHNTMRCDAMRVLWLLVHFFFISVLLFGYLYGCLCCLPLPLTLLLFAQQLHNRINSTVSNWCNAMRPSRAFCFGKRELTKQFMEFVVVAMTTTMI